MEIAERVKEIRNVLEKKARVAEISKALTRDLHNHRMALRRAGYKTGDPEMNGSLPVPKTPFEGM